MFKLVQCLVVLLFFCVGAMAAESDSFLWKIEKPGHKTSYILGTIHIGKNGARLDSTLENVLKSSDILMTEADLTGGGLDAMAQVGALAIDINGSLSSKLGGDYVSRIARQNGLDREMLEYFKPWLVFAMVVYAIPNGYSADYGIDMLLTKRAEMLNKPVVSLEDGATSIMHFANLPEDKLIRAIRYYTDQDYEIKQMTKKLVDLYDTGNTLGLVNYMSEIEGEEYPSEDSAFWQKWMEDTIIIKRNRNWIGVIEAETARKSALIAFGAAHLYGDEGIIELLKKRGYTLTPVLSNQPVSALVTQAPLSAPAPELTRPVTTMEPATPDFYYPVVQTAPTYDITNRYVGLRDQALTGDEEALNKLNEAAFNAKDPEARYRLGQIYYKVAETRDDYIFACTLIFMGDTRRNSADTEECYDLLTASEVDQALKNTFKLEYSRFER